MRSPPIALPTDLLSWSVPPVMVDEPVYVLPTLSATVETVLVVSFHPTTTILRLPAVCAEE